MIRILSLGGRGTSPGSLTAGLGCRVVTTTTATGAAAATAIATASAATTTRVGFPRVSLLELPQDFLGRIFINDDDPIFLGKGRTADRPVERLSRVATDALLLVIDDGADGLPGDATGGWIGGACRGWGGTGSRGPTLIEWLRHR